jgi:tetratricopeptide (TPR) repeat protein
MPALQSVALQLLIIIFLLGSASFAQPGKSAPLRSITVITEPNSTIWIDGVRFGTTDPDGKLTISSVPSGSRTIRVRSAGFAESTKPLAATARGDIAIKLAKTTDEAELAFQSADALTTVDREKAIAEYKRALKLRPNYVECYIGLARAYSERGEIENAFKAIGSAKRLKPGNAEVSAIEARLLKDTDEEEKAILVFKRSIREGKGFQPEAYTGLGMLYKDRAENAGGSGDYEQEAASYNEAAKNFALAVKQLGGAPDAIVVSQLLGLVYEKQNKFKEAIALYEEFLRTFPNAVEAEAVRSFIVQLKKQMAEQD